MIVKINTVKSNKHSEAFGRYNFSKNDSSLIIPFVKGQIRSNDGWLMNYYYNTNHKNIQHNNNTAMPMTRGVNVFFKGKGMIIRGDQSHTSETQTCDDNDEL